MEKRLEQASSYWISPLVLSQDSTTMAIHWCGLSYLLMIWSRSDGVIKARVRTACTWCTGLCSCFDSTEFTISRRPTSLSVNSKSFDTITTLKCEPAFVGLSNEWRSGGGRSDERQTEHVRLLAWTMYVFLHFPIIKSFFVYLHVVFLLTQRTCRIRQWLWETMAEMHGPEYLESRR